MGQDKNFELLLRRKNKLLIHANGSGLQSPDILEIARMVIAIGKNIESLGYSLSKDVSRKLLTLNSDELSMFYDTLVTRLKKLCGNVFRVPYRRDVFQFGNAQSDLSHGFGVRYGMRRVYRREIPLCGKKSSLLFRSSRYVLSRIGNACSNVQTA